MLIVYKVFMNNSSLLLSVNPALQNNGSSDMPYVLSQGSPQTPSRERFLSEPERFTFGSVSTERETEEESSSCFDYTSDQVSSSLARMLLFFFDRVRSGKVVNTYRNL